MKLILQRHTSVDTPNGLCYGQLDVPLAATFEDEKTVVLDYLVTHVFDKIYSSPLQRCRLLAESISGETQEVIYDSRLKELHFGDWEGKTWNDIDHTAEAQRWFADYVNEVCPNGESFVHLIERCRDFIEELKTRSDLYTVLIVCHAGTIRAFQTILAETDPMTAFNIPMTYGESFIFETNEKR